MHNVPRSTQIHVFMCMFSFSWAYTGTAWLYGNLNLTQPWTLQSVSQSRCNPLLAWAFQFLHSLNSTFIIFNSMTAALVGICSWQFYLAFLSWLTTLNIPFPRILDFWWRNVCSDLTGIFDRANCLLVDENFLPSEVLLNTSRYLLLFVVCVHVYGHACVSVCEKEREKNRERGCYFVTSAVNKLTIKSWFVSSFQFLSSEITVMWPPYPH